MVFADKVPFKAPMGGRTGTDLVYWLLHWLLHLSLGLLEWVQTVTVTGVVKCRQMVWPEHWLDTQTISGLDKLPHHIAFLVLGNIQHRIIETPERLLRLYKASICEKSTVTDTESLRRDAACSG